MRINKWLATIVCVSMLVAVAQAGEKYSDEEKELIKILHAMAEHKHATDLKAIGWCDEFNFKQSSRRFRTVLDRGNPHAIGVEAEIVANGFAVCAAGQLELGPEEYTKRVKWTNSLANKVVYQELSGWSYLVGTHLAMALSSMNRFGMPLPPHYKERAAKLLRYAQKEGLDVKSSLKMIEK